MTSRHQWAAGGFRLRTAQKYERSDDVLYRLQWPWMINLWQYPYMSATTFLFIPWAKNKFQNVYPVEEMYPLYLNWLLEKKPKVSSAVAYSLTHSITNSIRTPNISRHYIIGSFIHFSYSHSRIYHMVLTYDNCRHNASQNTSLRHPFVLDSAIEVTPGARDNAVVPREKNWLKRADRSRSRVITLQWEILHKCRFLCLWMAFYCLIFMGNGWTSLEIHGHPYNGFNGP